MLGSGPLSTLAFRPMTSCQKRYYFSLWGKCRKVLISRGYSPKEADEERHQIHLETLGIDKSSKDLTNADFSKIIAAFKATIHPDDLQAQLDAQSEESRRYIYGIRKAGFPEPYIIAISRDKFGTDDWQKLGLKELRLLRITLAARARSKAAKEA